MRRFVLAVVLALMMAIAVPAAADPPTVFGPFTDTFTDLDPCTGLDQEVTITITFYDHESHNNNFVGRANATGTTDTGYVMVGSHNGFRANNNVVIGSFKDVWRNPDTGAKFHAAGQLRIAGNSIVIDEFNLRCIGAPTLP